MQQFIQAKGSTKHIIFGENPRDAVLAKFGSLNLLPSQAWASAFAKLNHVVFKQKCNAQDFHLHRASLVQGVFARGILFPGPCAIIPFNRVLSHLKSVCSGVIFSHQSFMVLVYPAGLEEWKFLDNLENDGECPQLRYQIFRSDLGLISNPSSGRTGPMALRRPKAKTEFYRTVLVSKFHQLSLSTLLPGVATAADPCFYLIFPPTARSALAFVSSWLVAKKFDCKVLTSEQHGSWDWFLKCKAATKVVLIYESAVLTISKIPSLQKLLTNDNRPTIFWYIDDSLSSNPPWALFKGRKQKFGGITTTQILPVHGVKGGAIFLTPSFLMAEPEKALNFFRWFKSAVLEAPSGIWKLVCCSQMRQYLLDLAVEKATELKKFRSDHRDDDAMDANALKRGLSHEKCSQRFELHQAFSQFITSGLAYGRTSVHDISTLETSLAGIMDFCNGRSDDKFSSAASNIVFADPKIDPDQEDLLVAWFAEWSLNNIEQFRRFVVVGTGGTIHADRAYRFKTTTDEADLSPAKSTISDKPAVKFSLKNDSEISGHKRLPFADNGSSDDKIQGSTKRRNLDDYKTSQRQLVALEVTTSWYERQKYEGKGWEHVFVDQWEKAFDYIDPRLAAYVPRT